MISCVGGSAAAAAVAGSLRPLVLSDSARAAVLSLVLLVVIIARVVERVAAGDTGDDG